MLSQLECAPCIIDDIVGALKLLDLPVSLKEKVLTESLSYLSTNFNLRTIPSYYITHVHRILKKITGMEVPFRELRHTCNTVGMEISRILLQESQTLADYERFHYLAIWAIAGNMLDFRTVGAGYGFDVTKLHEKLCKKVEEGLKIDHIDKLYELLRNGRKIVLYVLDNVGEIAIDKLLIEEIIKLGNSVIAAVRGGPITSDVTWEDAKQVRLNETGANIVTTGPDTLGISWEEKSEDLSHAFNQASLVIAKGQANFYVFSEYKDSIGGNIFCLFTTKCDTVAKLFGFKGKVNLAVQLK